MPGEPQTLGGLFPTCTTVVRRESTSPGCWEFGDTRSLLQGGPWAGAQVDKRCSRHHRCQPPERRHRERSLPPPIASHPLNLMPLQPVYLFRKSRKYIFFTKMFLVIVQLLGKMPRLGKFKKQKQKSRPRNCTETPQGKKLGDGGKSSTGPRG